MRDTGDAGASLKMLAIIPAYNEEAHIEEVARGTLEHCDRVIVVDDGSTDRTGAVAAATGAEVIALPANRGKGHSLRRGFSCAAQLGYEWVLTLDADGQHDPDEIPDLVATARATGADVVVGDRLQDVERMPRVRRCANRFSTRILSWLAGVSLPDTQSGFRLIRRRTWEAAPPSSGRFSAESEFLVLAARRGAVVVGRKIRTIYGDERSKFRTFRDSCRFVGLVLRLMRRIVMAD